MTTTTGDGGAGTGTGSGGAGSGPPGILSRLAYVICVAIAEIARRWPRGRR